MRAMILAAGRGERMRPLTDVTPKPMLVAGGKPLIVHHIERLVAAGIADIVINTAWLGEKIESALKDGAQWGARIQYSREATALETAGGIAQACPLLGDEPFLVVNGDVYVEWDVRQAHDIQRLVIAEHRDLWVMLVPNPAHHPTGDFSLAPDGLLQAPGARTLTYAGVGVYAPRCFAALPANQPARLAPLIRSSIAAGRAIGQAYTGEWRDIGTTDRLAHLDAYLLAGQNVKQSML